MSPSSLLTRKHAYDEDISGTEAMLRRRKQLKTPPFLASSSALNMNWTKNDELLILKGIVKYQNETDSSYIQNWDAFYAYFRQSIELDLSKNQLISKVQRLKKRFRDTQARANDGQQVSFTNTHDEEVIKLSKNIRADKETEFAYEESKDQKKEDVPYVEHELASNPSMEVDNGEREKIEEDVVDVLSLLQDALEVAASFESLTENQRKFLLRNMKNIGANKRKELTDEWKALLAEDMQLNIKKQSFSAKLINTGFSA